MRTQVGQLSIEVALEGVVRPGAEHLLAGQVDRVPAIDLRRTPARATCVYFVPD
jgi:hypothetical protein